MVETNWHHTELKDHSFLVTGGAGFIGSHLVEYLLKHGAGKVIAFDNLCTGSMDNVKIFEHHPAYQFIRADICDAGACLQACRGVDFVFHEAALGSVPRSIKDPLATNLANINGFLNVLLAAREQKVKRVVYASSSSVFGDSPALPKSEDQLGNPLSPYAVTKRVNELYARVFADVYKMEIIGLRYFNIFGPRQNPEGPYAAAIPLFMMAILNDTPVFINGDGEQSRDFTYVANAVQANIKAMFTTNTAAIGQVFNIAVGHRITINELFGHLKDIAGYEGKAIHRGEREGDVKHSLADIDKAMETFGYRPETMARDGLEMTWKWFREQHNGPDN